MEHPLICRYHRRKYYFQSSQTAKMKSISIRSSCNKSTILSAYTIYPHKIQIRKNWTHYQWIAGFIRPNQSLVDTPCSPSVHMCCNRKVHTAAGRLCRGSKTFDPRLEICCFKNVFAKTSTTKCCGNKAISIPERLHVAPPAHYPQ